MAYKSLFGSDKPLSEAQFLAEFICKKCADYTHVTLPDKFWTLDNYAWWQDKIRTENMAAVKLLKKFAIQDIIAALKDKRAYWMQSLLNKKLQIIIKEYEVKRLEEEANRPKEEAPKVDDRFFKVIKPIGKKTKFSRLRD